MIINTNIADRARYTLPLDEYGEVVRKNKVKMPCYVECDGEEFDISLLSEKGKYVIRESLGLVKSKTLDRTYPALKDLSIVYRQPFTEDEYNLVKSLRSNGCSLSAMANYFDITECNMTSRYYSARDKFEGHETITSHETDDFLSSIESFFNE